MELQQAKELAKANVSDDEIATREKAFSLYQANRAAFDAYQEKRREKVKQAVADLDANDAELLALKAAADATEAAWNAESDQRSDPLTDGEWDAMGDYHEKPTRCLLTGAILFESDDIIADHNGCILRKALPLPDLPEETTSEDAEEEIQF